MDDSRVKKASDLVASLISPRAAAEGKSWAGLFSAWGQTAGERAAAHSRILDVARGIVIVETDHPGWTQTLQLSQGRILEELKRRFPELGLRGISFRPFRGPFAPAPAPAPPSPSEANPEAWADVPDGSGAGGSAAEAGPPDGELGKALEGLRKALKGGAGGD